MPMEGAANMVLETRLVYSDRTSWVLYQWVGGQVGGVCLSSLQQMEHAQWSSPPPRHGPSNITRGDVVLLQRSVKIVVGQDCISNTAMNPSR